MCFLTFPSSSSDRIRSVVAFRGISYSPALRLPPQHPPPVKSEKDEPGQHGRAQEGLSPQAGPLVRIGPDLQEARSLHHNFVLFYGGFDSESTIPVARGPRLVIMALRGSMMLDLQLPTRHEWQVREPAYGRLALELFEPGFALTAGNAFRRVLLSSIHGAAPTWVKIEGVLHEFSFLPGVTEDTLDILLNLRKVVFALHLNRPKILRLKAQGPKVVKAGDFEPDADVEILTPDLPLPTPDKDGVLGLEGGGERGRGYMPAGQREGEALPINAIQLDADLSRVGRVNFQIEPAAEGCERLVLEVWTDGSGAPGTP